MIHREQQTRAQRMRVFFRRPDSEQLKKQQAGFERLYASDQKIMRKREVLSSLLDDFGLDDDAEPEDTTAALADATTYLAYFNNISERNTNIQSINSTYNQTFELNPDSIDFVFLTVGQRNVNGVSLEQLLQNGVLIARRRPVQVFEHTLSSINPDNPLDPNTEAIPSDPVTETAAYTLATIYHRLPLAEPNALNAIHRLDQRFTGEVLYPMRNLGHTYHEAVTGTRAALFLPTHRDFPAAADLLERVDAIGSEDQYFTFVDQILTGGEASIAHINYRKATNFVKNGNHAEVYRRVRDTIGQIYDESPLSNPEKIGLSPVETTEIPDMEQSLFRMKPAITQRLRAGEEITLKDIDEDGEETVIGFVEHTHGPKGPIICIGKNIISETGEAAKLVISLENGNSIDWNLIHTPEDFPETYAALLHAGQGILQDVLNFLSQPAHQENPPQGEKRKRSNGNGNGKGHDLLSTDVFVLPDTPRRQSTSTTWRPTIIIDEEFQRDVSKRDPNLAQRIMTLVERFNEGTGGLTKFTTRSKEGNLIFSLRGGDIRGIIEYDRETGAWRLFDAGDRETVYEHKYNTQKRG